MLESISVALTLSGNKFRQGSVVRDKLDLEDRQLVAMTLSGDLKAYEAIVRRYQKLVYNVLYQMLRSHDSTADVMQETFLRAFRGLKSYKPEYGFKLWLLRIATNAAINWLRDNAPHESLDALLENDPGSEPVGRDEVERQAEWNFSHAKLVDALASLPARHRHAFILRYQYDLSYAEISHIMSESESSTKSLLFRVRERLRDILAAKNAGGVET